MQTGTTKGKLTHTLEVTGSKEHDGTYIKAGSPGTTIAEWQRLVHDLARAKGWHPEGDPLEANRALALLMLVTTELAEAAECIRLGELTTTRDEKGKPTGLAIEMADAAIRLLDVCAAWGIDLEAAMTTKHAYNLTRPHRHGGKRA